MGDFMKIVVVGSGSSGNTTLIMGRSANIIIDAGISHRSYKLKLDSLGINDVNIDGLFITHEHGDHTKYLHSHLKKMTSPFYINERSYLSLNPAIYNNVKTFNHKFINPFGKVKINDLEIEAIPLSHDTVECLGFIIREDDKMLVYIADTGYLDSEYRGILTGADCYLFEANHDPVMEMNSNRDQYLKNRVLGDEGHLSNEDCAVNLSYLITDKTKSVCFLHRSRECNTIDLIKDTVFKVFEDFSIDVSNINFYYAEQDYPTLIEV